MSDWRSAVDRRLADLHVPPQRRIEIVEELAADAQDRYEELRSAGHADAEARRVALAEIDGRQLASELTRVEPRPSAELLPPGTRRSTFMANLWQDLRYAVRSIRKAPAFSAIVIATLALGIGANAAIFSIADAVLLRPYPYPNIERMVLMNERARNGNDMSVSWLNYQDWVAQARTFEHLGIYRPVNINFTGGDQPERLTGAMASSALFGATGIQPAMGRVFGPGDDRPGSERVAVISDRFWRSRLNADASILGRTLLLNGDPHTVVGVMPPGMRFPSRLTDVWLPLGPTVPALPKDRGSHPNLWVLGKLKPGASFESAVAEMEAIAVGLEQQHPNSNTGLRVAMTPYFEAIVRNIRPTLYVLSGAVGFVLLIACANLANLLLARSERRQRDLAVRRALGADRWRLVQQLLTESMVLAAAGGALGVLLATWMVGLFVASRPTIVPRIDMVGVDGRVLAFAAALSIATGVLFGLLPALRGSSPDLRSALTVGGRSLTGSSRRLRSALVVVEVALALTLLVGAGLMIRSFTKLMAIEPGFNPENVVTMRMTLPAAKYGELPSWTAFHESVVQRVASIPGVTAAAVNSGVPLEGGGAEAGLLREGQPLPQPGQQLPVSLFQSGTPDYFDVMGISLVKGRFFDERDSAGSVKVAIVDETLVARVFGGEDPLGKRVAFETLGDHTNPQPIWREIVGVVTHVRHYALAGGPSNVQIYTPLSQLPIWFERRRPSMALFVRTAMQPDSVMADIRKEVGSIDRDIPLYNVQTMERYLAQTTEQPRLSVWVLGGLGALALVLAVIGVYGVVSYSVAQRTQEIGVRVALGATRGDVLRLVVGNTMALVLTGVALGVAAGLALASTVRTMLYQVDERDPSTFAMVAALLAAVGLLAGIVPALRATRVDPITALRES